MTRLGAWLAALRVPRPSMTRLGAWLAALQIAQIGSGLAGQALLLVRWSPHRETDLFLLLSSVPWLVSALTLVAGVELALPAAYHRARTEGHAESARRLVVQIAVWGGVASAVAALVSAVIVTLWAYGAGLDTASALWLGIALGAQAVPVALSGVGRGLLVAQDRVLAARLTLLAGSVTTTAGYALLPGPPSRALPLTLLGAALVMLWLVTAALHPVRPGSLRPAATLCSLHPGWRELVPALAALSATALLAHAALLIERAAVQSLGTGTVAALAVAARATEAAQMVIVAATVLPAVPRWAQWYARGQQDALHTGLRQSLCRAGVLSGAVALGLGLLANAGRAFATAHDRASVAQAATWLLALLPRFVLLSALQPLIHRHFACGTPWIPLAGSAAGVIVLAGGAGWLVPRAGATGFALAAALSTLPGWIILLGVERRRVRHREGP